MKTTKDVKKLTDKMIKNGEFCKVVTTNLEEVGLPKNSFVYIAGTQAIPEDENDLYTQRVKFIVCRMDGDHVDSAGFFMVDPRNVKRVSKAVNKRLYATLQEDFGEKEDETSN